MNLLVLHQFHMPSTTIFPNFQTLNASTSSYYWVTSYCNGPWAITNMVRRRHLLLWCLRLGGRRVRVTLRLRLRWCKDGFFHQRCVLLRALRRSKGQVRETIFRLSVRKSRKYNSAYVLSTLLLRTSPILRRFRPTYDKGAVRGSVLFRWSCRKVYQVLLCRC